MMSAPAGNPLRASGPGPPRLGISLNNARAGAAREQRFTPARANSGIRLRPFRVSS